MPPSAPLRQASSDPTKKTILLGTDSHLPNHAQVVMQGADVRKSPSIRKSDPETCHAKRRLRKPKPFLGRRDDESRVRAVGSGIDDSVPGPIRIDSHVGG